MEKRPTIVLVLSSGGDFSFQDVELITRHINGKWKSKIRPHIVCFWDKATTEYNLGNVELIPYPVLSGIWSKLTIFSPKLEKYRPFLYVDLDTVIHSSLENIFEIVKDQTKFITLEDFYEKGKLATGLVWVPANSIKVKTVWDNWTKQNMHRKRMDFYIRSVVTADLYWQNLTNTIKDFKPGFRKYMMEVPDNTDLICFHGKPRIFEAEFIEWVKVYINTNF
jgi:hypothetical protein